MITIMHIAEAFGGGIITFLANLANHQAGQYNVIIIHGIRPETHANYRDFFDPRIKLVHVRSFRQQIDLRHTLQSIREVRELIRIYQPDVIHMHSSQAGVVGKIAAIGHTCRKVYSPHGFSFLRQDVSRVKRRVFVTIERLFTRFDCVLVASSATEHKAAQLLTHRAILITNGINPTSLLPYKGIRGEGSTVTIAMVGRALPQKNPAMFNEIARLMPDCHFEWIGDGALCHLLSSFNIHVVGWGPREEALDYLAKSDIYVMTSLWEGMPMSLLEAMYLRKPCVVTDVVGNRDVIRDGHNGYVCRDVSQFVTRLRYLIDNPDVRARMGQQAHEDVVNHYTSQVMAARYSEVYQEGMKR